MLLFKEEQFMGHADVATTAIYLGSGKADLKTAMKERGLI